MPDVLVSEVGPRDGLQSIRSIMPLEAKKRWIAAEAAAGVQEIEVGSFVPAKLLPQLADTAEVVAFARTIAGLTVAVPVPNLKGAEAAVRAGAHKITIPLSASETHSLKNVRRTHAQMIWGHDGARFWTKDPWFDHTQQDQSQCLSGISYRTIH